MLTPPSFIDDATIGRAVGAHWLPEVETLEHLPWGFGAHHWRATGAGRALFVTLDHLAPRHTAASLEAAYRGAATLAASGLDVVCAPLPTRSGRFTAEAGPGALSVTPWLDGRSPSEDEAAAPAHAAVVLAALEALHRADPPDGLPVWAPRAGPGFAARLRERTRSPWTSGPLAEEARGLLAANDAAIAACTARYLELAGWAAARRDHWVPTHGEPHHANQVVTGDGLRLADWESLALAPAERDLVDLAGQAPAGPEMIELFRLDWRLVELDEYARWFAAPHTGTDDDHTALDGLREELADAENPLPVHRPS
ncbi:phosphotransferase [Jiangella sp. DSM 45060]|uniref:phosphotransferase n=1 Tax=Jiangella sp. DSM 45060 TaxID=1798224 RepID=UPI00087AA1A8|nr:phosphotransferase [Jiangella sp. DSM 45060]SDT72344.1 spectinomycin phosphotransferase [Jiangella sp. DSM 45060]